MRTALVQRVPKWLPKSVWLRGLLTILAARKLTAVVRRGRGRVSSAQRAKAVNELKKLVPPPRPRALGGERIGTHTYERFLSVVEWKPERAAPLLEADLVWRARVQPRACRPQDLPNACSQSGWQVLMVSTKASPAPPPASPAPAVVSDVPQPEGESSEELARSSPWYTACLALAPWLRTPSAWPSRVPTSSGSGGRWQRSLDRLTPSRLFGRSRSALELHPPHSKPRNMQWRYTKHGLPITLIEVRSWYPERCGTKEVVMHTAYMMEHYIRRMPAARGKRVGRVCLLLDMRGFRPATLPYVRECINVLRLHYPGRLGAACFYKVPAYFHPVWKLIKPLLDEEIMNKVHFLPGSVQDREDAIEWCNQRDLPVN